MKRTILFTFLVLLVAGCSKNNETITYPVVLGVNDYSLIGTSCSWQNVKQDSLYIITSQTDLVKYVSTQQNDIPAVDFTKYSLLFVRGVTSSGIQTLSKSFQQTSANNYDLNIDITLNLTAVAQSWAVAVLTPKLAQNSVIKLTVTKH